MSLEIWKNRYSVKKFSKQDNFADEINYLKQVIEYIPIQRGINSHFWLLLSNKNENERQFKDFLFRNVFALSDGSEHMYPILSAPYVFLSIINREYYDQYECVTNVGVHAGVLLSEGLRLGLDVSTLNCRDMIANSPNSNSLRKQFDTYVKDCLSTKLKKYKKEINNPKFTTSPSIAVCFGKGLPLEKHMFEMVDDKPIKVGQKQKKKFSNIEIIDDK